VSEASTQVAQQFVNSKGHCVSYIHRLENHFRLNTITPVKSHEMRRRSFCVACKYPFTGAQVSQHFWYIWMKTPACVLEVHVASCVYYNQCRSHDSESINLTRLDSQLCVTHTERARVQETINLRRGFLSQPFPDREKDSRELKFDSFRPKFLPIWLKSFFFKINMICNSIRIAMVSSNFTVFIFRTNKDTNTTNFTYI
jgi:hypothetical protein